MIIDGVVSTVAGNGVLSYINDPNPLNCSFNSPAGIEFDMNGNLMIADGGNHCIRLLHLNDYSDTDLILTTVYQDPVEI